MYSRSQVLQASRAAGVEAGHRLRRLLSNESERDKPHRLLLLVQSRAGYLRLSELLTRAWLGKRVPGARRAAQELVRRGWERWIDLRCPAGCKGTRQRSLQDHGPQVNGWRRNGRGFFPAGSISNCSARGAAQTEAYVERRCGWQGRSRCPWSPRTRCSFLRPEDFTAHEARVCIAEGQVLGDQRRPRLFTPKNYFMSQAEMAELFADLPEALANSVQIAKRCSLALELGKSRLPEIPTPGNVGLDDYLVQLAKQGLERRLASLFPDAERRAKRRGAIASGWKSRRRPSSRWVRRLFPDRRRFHQLGQSRTACRSARARLGRGIAGRLFARHHRSDPLRYEPPVRALPSIPERVSMPDFDIDFCERGRDRVIEYVKQKYGAQSVSQIATFGTMAARAVVRDVGRVMEWATTAPTSWRSSFPFNPASAHPEGCARDGATPRRA